MSPGLKRSIKLSMGYLYILSLGSRMIWMRAAGQEIDLHMVTLYTLTGSWPGGNAQRIAVEMAIEDVNARADILAGYKLVNHWTDTKNTPVLAMNYLYRMLSTGTPKLVLNAGASSLEAEVTSPIAYIHNVVQIGNGATSPTLSNKLKYPWYFRVSSQDARANPARLAFLREFRWTRVAVLYENFPFFVDGKNTLEAGFRDRNITVIASVGLESDHIRTLNVIKETDARIIFAFAMQHVVVEILCQAKRMELVGNKHVWILVGWYEDKWWLEKYDNLDCNTAELTRAIDRSFAIDSFYINPLQQRGLAGITSNQFMTEFLYRTGGNSPIGTRIVPQTYDAVWVIAMALNETIKVLEQNGSGMRLENFTYDNHEMGSIIYKCMSKVSFLGVRGLTRFDKNGDPLGPIQIQMMNQGEYRFAGGYNPETDRIDWSMNMSEIFPGKRFPRDSTIIIFEVVFVSLGAYVTMSLIAGLGILLAAIFLCINIKYRHTRTIKMTAPNLNNITLTGCIISYLAVLFQDLTLDTAGIYCKVYLLLKTIGFSLTFGALFAKTWRIHSIFAKRTVQHKVIKDRQLILMVAVLVVFNVALAVVWELTDPMHIHEQPTGGEMLDLEADILYKEEVGICHSLYMTYFYGIIYTIYGLLLLLGVFLAWETRKVHIEGLNDSKHIGFCIYNMLVPTLVGTAIYHILEKQVQAQYILSSLCQIVAITLTQCIIFIPKIMKLRENPTHPETTGVGIPHSSTREITSRDTILESRSNIEKSINATRG